MSTFNKNFFTRKTITSIIVMNLIFIVWSLDQNRAFADENWVEVEQSPLVIENKGEVQRITFLDYKERRQQWSFRFSIFSANPRLENYTLSTTNLNARLKSEGGGSFEGTFSISYNVGVFSIGADIGAMMGSFEKDVKVMQPKASVHIMADAIFNNPYAVPFFKLGASQMTFENPSASDVQSPDSDIASFVAFGGMFALDWFQKELAMDAYFGYGLDATFLVVEYEMFSKIPMTVEGIELNDVKQNNLKIGLQLVF